MDESDVFFIVIIAIILILIGIFAIYPAVNKSQGVGVITDKWTGIVKAGFGSREAYFFEINNSFFVEVNQFDYHNYNVNQTYRFDAVKNPRYENDV